jgi:hypothetical protein
MRKSLLAVLAAATALAPIAATAQDWGRGGGGRRGGGASQPSQGGGAEARGRPDWARGSRGDRPSYTPAPAPAPQVQQQTLQSRPSRGDGQGYRAQRQQDRQAFRTERRDDRQDFRRERLQDRQALGAGQVTPQQFRQDRRDDVRDFRRDRQDDRRDFRQDQRDDRQQFRRDNGRNGTRGNDWNRGGSWNDNRSWNDRRDFSDRRNWNGSRNWNRTWRNDNRYDWRGWRDRNRNVFRLPRYYAPRGYGYGYQRFGIGVTLGSILFAQNYWISDPWTYRLPPAEWPYQWVRYYNDAMLVDTETGEVVDVIYDIFW